MRFAAAALFVILAGLVAALSDALLQVVGIALIDRLMDIPAVSFIAAGLAFGIALGVMDELSSYLSPFLMFRLLRLLLPIVLAVVAVFLLALPVQGFGALGGVSVAGTLIGIGIAVTILISVALDGSDPEAVTRPAQRFAVKGLALVLPLLAGLAGYALWLRVAQHGWTPQRLMVAGAVLVLAGHGVLYALAVLRRRHWMARIRAGNRIMALALLGFAALWMTLVIHPERISVQSQMARYDRGLIGAGALPLWEFRDRWGHAGRGALIRLAEIAEEGDADAQVALERLAQNPYPVEDAGTLPEEVAARLPVFALSGAEDADLVHDILAAAHPEELRHWRQNCTLEGAACAVVTGRFVPSMPGLQALIVHDGPRGSGFHEGFGRDADGSILRLQVRALPDDARRLLEALQDGTARIAPADLNALHMDGGQILLTP